MKDQSTSEAVHNRTAMRPTLRTLVMLLALVAVLASQSARLGSRWLENIARVRWLAWSVDPAGNSSLSELSSVEQILEHAIQLNPRNRPAYQLLGFVHEASGNADEAACAWRLANASPVFIERGQMALRREAFEEALTWYLRAVQAAPEQSQSWYHLGVAQTALEQWDDAVTSLQRAIDNNNFSQGQLGLSDVYYRLGEVYRQSGTEGAVETYHQALAHNQYGDVENAGLTFYQLGQFAQNGGDYQLAIVYFQKALQHLPDHYWSHLRLGMSYLQTQQYSLAEAELNQAQKIAPKSQWSYLQLGHLYKEIGRTEQAKQMYRHVLALDPENQTALTALEELK